MIWISLLVNVFNANLAAGLTVLPWFAQWLVGLITLIFCWRLPEKWSVLGLRKSNVKRYIFAWVSALFLFAASIGVSTLIGSAELTLSLQEIVHHS